MEEAEVVPQRAKLDFRPEESPPGRKPRGHNPGDFQRYRKRLISVNGKEIDMSVLFKARPIPSHPIPSHPIPSHPIGHPISFY